MNNSMIPDKDVSQMIDFVRLLCRDIDYLEVKERLNNLMFLEFKATESVIDTSATQPEYKVVGNGSCVGKWNHLKFKLYGTGTLIIEGSLHKFYNSIVNKERKNNYDDFTLRQVKSVVSKLKETVGVESSKIEIMCFEFGVNLYPERSRREYLENWLLHKRNEGSRKKYGKTGLMREFDYQQYTFKVYDKTDQSQIEENCLRIEMRIKRKVKVAAYRIKLLDDLCNPVMISRLIKLLLDAIDDSLILREDMLVNSTFRRAKRKELLNINFWRGLTTDRLKYKRMRSKLKHIVKGQNNWQPNEELKAEVAKTWDFLLSN